jgi:hypothetical protein
MVEKIGERKRRLQTGRQIILFLEVDMLFVSQMLNIESDHLQFLYSEVQSLEPFWQHFSSTIVYLLYGDSDRASFVA